MQDFSAEFKWKEVRFYQSFLIGHIFGIVQDKLRRSLLNILAFLKSNSITLTVAPVPSVAAFHL